MFKVSVSGLCYETISFKHGEQEVSQLVDVYTVVDFKGVIVYVYRKWLVSRCWVYDS